MASPPFGVNTSVPADNDIVSQFPAVNRADKDQFQSWLEIDHDTNGNHVVIHMPYQSSAPATPSASIAALYFDINSNLVVKKPDGQIYYIGDPPGTITYTAGATADNGWALINGQAILRTGIGAALFARIGTTYGPGDGSTTFNVPDAKGRFLLMNDGGVGRITSTYFGGNSPSTNGNVNNTGQNDHFTIALTNLPNITPTGSLSFSTGSGGGTPSVVIQGAGATLISNSAALFNVYGINAYSSLTGSFTGNPIGGSSTPFSTVPNAIVLQAQIKL
jgi:microcystin-dependent protein